MYLFIWIEHVTFIPLFFNFVVWLIGILFDYKTPGCFKRLFGHTEQPDAAVNHLIMPDEFSGDDRSFASGITQVDAVQALIHQHHLVVLAVPFSRMMYMPAWAVLFPLLPDLRAAGWPDDTAAGR